MDEMEKCGHYRHWRHWRRDFDLVQELGIRFSRYGPPLHTTLLGAQRYDCSFADETFLDLHRRNLIAIVDLCHFGLPAFLGNFQNPDFPAVFADYARAFAQRYPWIQLYTPINEMSICVGADGVTRSAGEIFGYAVITHQYYKRYRLPVMHTETNLCQGLHGDEAVKWLRKEWANVLRVRNNGMPIVGFTWYSLTDQMDWNTQLSENNGRVNALGPADLDRTLRQMGKAYRDLIQAWTKVLPAQSVCLQVPVALAEDYPRRYGSAATAASAASAAPGAGAGSPTGAQVRQHAMPAWT